MEDQEEWSGRATELLAALNTEAETLKVDEKDRNWPRSPQALSRRLTEVTPNLQEAGIRITRSKGKSRTITLAKIPSLSSVAPEALQDNNLHKDDTVEDTADSMAQSSDLPSSRDLFDDKNITNAVYKDATGDDTTGATQIPSTPKSNKNNGADDIDDKDGIFAKVDPTPKIGRDPDAGTIHNDRDDQDAQNDSSSTSPIDNDDDEPWIVI
jgi:hypothetical protein